MSSSGPPRAATSPGTPPANPIEATGWRELLCWLVRRRRRFVVAGESMKPWLAADDHVLVDPKAKLRVGDVVVAKHPFRSDLHLVKQIVRFDEAGCAQLAGINPQASTDSRTLGMFAPALVLGRVTSRF